VVKKNIKDMKYKTIYLDPPWKICTGGTSIRKKTGIEHKGWGTPQNHYPVMNIKDIIKELQFVKDISDEQCHMYMWVVNNKIEDALLLIKELGFTYITNVCWVKDKIGMGQYFRGQHELLFFCRKGNPMPYKYKDGKKTTVSSVVIEPRSVHSRKPHTFYDIIEKVSYGPYIELFARNRREGWDSWGPHSNINDLKL
jgi:N6-adenosine-specific RNA methylase IME4